MRTFAAVAACMLVSTTALPQITTPQHLLQKTKAYPTYLIKLLDNDHQCEVVEAGWNQRNRMADKQVYVSSISNTLCDDDGGVSPEDYMQIFSPTAGPALEHFRPCAAPLRPSVCLPAVAAWGKVAELCYRGHSNSTLDEQPARLASATKRDIEIRPLVYSGAAESMWIMSGADRELAEFSIFCEFAICARAGSTWAVCGLARAPSTRRQQGGALSRTGVPCW